MQSIVARAVQVLPFVLIVGCATHATAPAVGQTTNGGGIKTRDGHIRGVVVDSRTGHALEGAVVRIISDEARTRTGPDGAFQVTLAPGSYTLRTSSPGYEADDRSVTVRAGGITTVDIQLQHRPPIDVTISVEGDRVIVTPDPVFIERGDAVRFTSADGPFAVHFNPLSPFSQRRLRGAAGDTLSAVVRTGLFAGKYSYFVAVEVKGKIFTEDPDLINDEEEDPGN